MEPHLGEIILVAFNYAPTGWATCAGQLLPINANLALYSLLSTRYGGDGVTNFRLPNLSAPANMLYIIALTGIYPSRQ